MPCLPVPSLVNLTCTKKTDIQMDMHFSLRLKPNDRQRFRTAYLNQSFPLHGRVAKSNHLAFVDEFCFSLAGTFTSDPSTSHTPKYLHISPLRPEWINDMPCLSLTSSMQLFYWSSDRSGKEKIAEADWEKYGLPKLKVETWIGSVWGLQQPYLAVWDYLRLINYDVNGEHFAREHGHPILIKGDPHVRTGDCEPEQTYYTPRPRHTRNQISEFEERHNVSGRKHSGKKGHVERKGRKKRSTTNLNRNSIPLVGSEKLLSSRFQITIISTPFI
ncbi:hypothetical protein L218DRAFT_734001 [Marasmius fiardii PR-910]|nr:hypothetical protein L218DRAFT_734001 [Marasmius fiardii PR-910]